MPASTTIPVWLVAAVLAGLAPACAHALEALLQRRLRRRTLDVIAQARRPDPRGVVGRPDAAAPSPHHEASELSHGDHEA